VSVDRVLGGGKLLADNSVLYALGYLKWELGFAW
jgi:hypothetical protein